MRALTLQCLVLLSAAVPPTAAAAQASLPIQAGETATISLPPPPAPPLPKGSISGRVTCNDTRQPARGAMVMLSPLKSKSNGKDSQVQPREAMTRVGVDGTYTLLHVAPGDYAVIALLPGYLSDLDGLVISESDTNAQSDFEKRLAATGVVHVTANGVQTKDVTLERGATVSGRVLYTDGVPATQVSLELEDVNAKPAAPGEGVVMNIGAIYRTMFTHQSLSTDDQGHFRISGIQPGTYRLAVTQPFAIRDMEGFGGSASMLGMVSGTGDPGALRIYAGDTVHRKSAKTFDLRAGDTIADLDIRLPIDGMHPVTVRLVATDGRAINSCNVQLNDTADETLSFHAESRQDGAFICAAIPPGTYTISARKLVITPVQPFAQPTAAFADAAGSIIVKETDPAEITLTAKEVPLPPTPKEDE